MRFLRFLLKLTLVAILVLVSVVIISNESHENAFASGNTPRPSISIISPSNGATIQNGTLIVTGTAHDSGSGINIVQVKLNSGSAKTATPKATGDWSVWTASFNISQSGTNTITARAIDNAGNMQYVRITVTVDVTTKTSTAFFDFLVRNQGIPDSSLAALYGKHSKSSDIITEFTKDLLSTTITSQVAGQKSAAYFSLADLQANAANLHSLGYTWIAYDLEGSYSPPSEWNNPIASIQQASQIAHNNGLKLLISPAGVSSNDYTSMAQNSDGWILQAMDLIAGDPTTMSNTIHETVSKIRSGNPNEIIILQDSINVDTVGQMNNAWDLTKDVVNGITIFYSNSAQIPQMAQVLTHIDGIG